MARKSDIAFVREHISPSLPAPVSEAGISGWIRKNLFSSPANTVLTIFAGILLYLTVPGTLNWSIFEAVWSGKDRLDCATVLQGGQLPEDRNAACWPYVAAYLKQFIYGRYPDAELWRVNLVFILFFAGLIPMLIPNAPLKRENIIFMLVVFPVVALILLTGGNFSLNGFLLPEALIAPSATKFWMDYIILTLVVLGLVWLYQRATDNNSAAPLILTLVIMAVLAVIIFLVAFDFGLSHVETTQWGGFLMTLVIAITGIVASLPIGILLALGRRSNMPAVKLFSVIFIEFWRGVPLITVLFMSSVMLPLFLPDGVTFDKLLRALIGVALFSSAYMAEVVRGGLQAIPKGQFEGAAALG